MALRKTLTLRRPRSGRVEGRSPLIQQLAEGRGFGYAGLRDEVLGLLTAVVFAFLQAHPAQGAQAAKRADDMAPTPSFACSAAQTAIERLICAEPSLAFLDNAMVGAFRDGQEKTASPTEREARLADQRRWLDEREEACPGLAPSPAGKLPQGAGYEAAAGCLKRIYEQRVAVLRYEHNAAAWPRTRFRPTIVEGSGTKLCEDLGHDLAASFLGRGLFVNPLGEREIGFIPVSGLGDDATVVLRADIDVYNLGKPFPVLQWITDNGGLKLPTVEYRAYDTPADLLSAIGRGVEPLAYSVREAARPVIDIDRLPAPNPKRLKAQRRAAFARDRILSVDEAPRFFRYEDRVYLLAPMDRAPGVPGDLGVYRLYDAARLHRVCVFDTRGPRVDPGDDPLAIAEVAALRRAAGPLLPTGRLCAGIGDEARTLAEHAQWRPWVLDRRIASGDPTGERLALYMRNRGLTGPERVRQYGAYVAARAAAIAALAPFYQAEFGRAPAEAKRYAGLYLDRLISDGFETDPDDDSVAALFAPDFAQKHAAQQAALVGDTAALRLALGPEPKAVAKGVKGDLDEPLVSDALDHPETMHVLLDFGLDPNETGASGRTPLMTAARLDLVEAAGMLLAQGAAPDAGAEDAVAQTDSAGDPLCMTGDGPVTDTPGRTALSYAAEFGSPEMVRLLLDHGAASAKPDHAGRRPADYVKQRTSAAAVRSDVIAEMLK
jgi:uncharacterized protein YecT (DUF1311 family)